MGDDSAIPMDFLGNKGEIVIVLAPDLAIGPVEHKGAILIAGAAFIGRIALLLEDSGLPGRRDVISPMCCHRPPNDEQERKYTQKDEAQSQPTAPEPQSLCGSPSVELHKKILSFVREKRVPLRSQAGRASLSYTRHTVLL